MSLITPTIVGYIISSLLNSKGAKTAKDELSSGLWNWIRPILIEEEGEKPVEKIENAPESDSTKNRLKNILADKVEKDPDFLAKLQAEIAKAEKGGLKPSSGNYYHQEMHNPTNSTQNMNFNKG